MKYYSMHNFGCTFQSLRVNEDDINLLVLCTELKGPCLRDLQTVLKLTADFTSEQYARDQYKHADALIYHKKWIFHKQQGLFLVYIDKSFDRVLLLDLSLGAERFHF